MAQTITKSLVNGLKPNGKEFFVRDDKLRGFAVRVQPKGPITFVVNSRIAGGRACKFTIGRPDLMTVAEARQAAEEPLRLMRQGIDPHIHRKQQSEEQQRNIAKDKALSITLIELFSRYMATRERKPSTVRDLNWVVGSLLEDWNNKPVRSITRADVQAKFISIRNAKGQTTAVKCQRVLKALFNFALEEEIEGETLLNSNPVNVLKAKRYDLSIRTRDRFLDDQEIYNLLFYAYMERGYPTKETFQRDNKDGVTEQGLNYILLILYTGLRRSEAESLRWENVDFQKRLFVVKDTKNGRDHVVPMSFSVSRLLKEQKEIAGDAAWVFPSPGSKSGHISEPRSQLDRLIAVTKIEKFSFHDLRRTFAHHATLRGSDFFLIKKSLNHRSGDITESYIGRTVEMIRPVFEAISRGYLSYFDEDLARDIYEPHDDPEIKVEHGEYLNDPSFDPETQF